MRLSLARRVALAGLLCAATACSRSPSPAAAATPAMAGKPAASTDAAVSVCEQKLLTTDDLSGIFDVPFTGTRALQGDATTCYFVAGDNKLRVSLRPGHGRTMIDSFTSGRMNEYAKWQLLSGVGEQAIWKPGLAEVSARNGDVLCEVAPEAGSLFLAKNLKAAGEIAQQQKLGGLCNTIFARLHLPGATAAQTAPIRKSAGGNVVQSACEKDVTSTDVADIITVPVIKQAAAINPQSCSYDAAAGASVTITLAQGEDGKTFWDMMSNPANAGALSPLAGVGDTALHARGGTMMIARKGDLVCSVGLVADNKQLITKARGEDLAKKLGGLCGKVFAARG